ncbi:MAG: nucleoside recognition protein [Clostridia bacterium]|nr:nucleoside recognition protein [Clostridia bacterium]
MLNLIWGGMILISLAVSLFTGQMEETAAAAVTGAGSAVETCFSLLGILCLWSGLSRIGERAGLIRLMARLLRPILKFLFPKLEANAPAGGSIVMNMVANLLGMGNAATPLGIKAMQDLSRLNRTRTTASNEMCMLVVVNTASIQLLPTTLISLRLSYGSTAPGEIIVPVWIVSICALLVGVTVAKLLERRTRL